MLDLESSFQQGFSNDLFYAQYYYFIFRTLGENYNLINELDNDFEKRSLGYIQNSSGDLAILSLAKVLDNNPKSNSLTSLISECKLQTSDHFPLQINISHIPEELQPYSALRLLYKQTGIEITKPLKTSSDLIDYIQLIIKTEEFIKAKKSIKTARDKSIAHNDKQVAPIDTFWNDFSYLVTTSRLIQSILGEVYIHTAFENDISLNPNHINMQIIINAEWIYEKLISLFGEEKVNVWWID